jgi:MraZ protein
MTSFVGDYTGRIDSKGRVVFPAPLKKQLLVQGVDKFVVKKDIYEKCLVLYTMDEWERQNEILRSKLNPYDRKHKMFLREYYRNSSELHLDGSNRILLPSDLVEYADIDKEVAFSGQDRKIEIWAKEQYESVAKSAEDFAQLADEIMGGELPQQ